MEHGYACWRTGDDGCLGNSTTAERLRGGSKDADVGNTSNLRVNFIH